MDYIQKIKEIREDKDKTQTEIGKIINKSQQGYAHIENRKAKLTIEDLMKLCEYYNLSADYILGFTDDPKQLPKK